MTKPSAKKFIKPRIPETTAHLKDRAQEKNDNKTKPKGSLGRLEECAVRACCIQNTLEPDAGRKLHLVFAGDHGVTQQGVSAFPSEVTVQMVANFCNGGAAINVLCRRRNVDMHVIDAGVKGDLGFLEDRCIHRKVAQGSADFTTQPAMSPAQAEAALQNGIETVDECCPPDSSPHIVGLGEMGIGNTTSAAAIVCAITGLDAHKAAGRGTGIDDAALAVKAEAIEKALDLHSPRADDALDILYKIGGYEIAGMTGAALAAASRGMMVMLDGLISTAAGCCAVLLEPRIREYLFVGHASVEPAQQSACEFTGQRPLLDLQMRLGEGTGAVLAMDVVDAGCAVMRDMASFSDAGVSRESEH